MDFPYMTFHTRSGLAAIGVTDNEIKRALRAGTVVALGHGGYADAASYEAMTAEQRHVLSIRAAASACSRPVVSHQSAAVLHGLSMWNPDLSRVHLSLDSSHHGRRTATLHLHPNRLDDLVPKNGLTVTSVAKTAVDLARTLPFEATVCVVDSALTQTNREALTRIVRASAGVTGIRAAKRVVAFADGRAESVGESRSRVYLQHYGFPAPELQVTLRNPNTLRVMRPDMLIGGVILEFDGKVKYTSRDVLFAEKQREDELTSLGWVVVRWTWEDLSSEAGSVKLRRGLQRAAHLPPPVTIRL